MVTITMIDNIRMITVPYPFLQEYISREIREKMIDEAGEYSVKVLAKYLRLPIEEVYDSDYKILDAVDTEIEHLLAEGVFKESK